MKRQRRKRRDCPACDKPAQKWERVLLLEGGRIRTGLVCTNCASQSVRIVNMSKPGAFSRCEVPGCALDAVWCSLHAKRRELP
jgi:hypothetical protein